MGGCAIGLRVAARLSAEPLLLGREQRELPLGAGLLKGAAGGRMQRSCPRLLGARFLGARRLGAIGTHLGSATPQHQRCAAMEAGNQPEGKYRKDYAPPPFAVATVDLIFSLGVGEVPTRVQCKLEVERQPSASGASTLQLDGEDLELLSVALNGQKLSEGAHYTVDSEYLTIMAVPEDEKFTVETEVAIKPHTNFQLSGLYKSSGMFCTQCEAEGFRRITFHQDRPDVMAVYRVRIEADASENPVLLSNGNKIAEGELPGGRHFSEWEDVRRRHPSFLCAHHHR